ncbi:MAG: tyrosine-type recombinase/integrase [Burkholderiales bacterium]
MKEKMGWQLPRGVTVRPFKRASAIQIAFTHKGRQCREILHGVAVNQRGIDFAERQLRQINEEIRAGTFDYASRFPGTAARVGTAVASAQTTFGDFAEAYAKRYWASKHESTRAGYASWLDHRILPELGKVKLKDLHRETMIEFLSKQAEQLTLKSLRNLASVMRKMLAEAVKSDLITSNPLSSADIDLADLSPVEMHSSSHEIDPFTLDEMDKLVSAAEGQMANLIRLWRWTGLRTGEVLALRWKDVDWAEGVIHVRRNVVRRIEKEPKTKSGIRRVDLCREAIAALRDQERIKPDGVRVFVHPRTGLPLRASNDIYKAWLDVVRRAEVRYRRPYQLRHTYASTLLTAGANIQYLARQMGHSSASTLLDFYAVYVRENAPRPLDALVEAALSRRTLPLAGENN